MYSKSSTTTKLYLFGDVLMRVCIILSFVLSNLAIQTTMVSADTGVNSPQEELLGEKSTDQSMNSTAIEAEEDIRNVDKQYFSRLLMNSSVFTNDPDHLSKSIQYENFEYIAKGYIVQSVDDSKTNLSEGNLENIEFDQEGLPYLYDDVPGFTMVYFDNMYLTPPAYSHLSGEAINYDWLGSSPDGLPADKFSIRWYGQFVNNEITAAEEFTFTANSDDGVRLQINGTTIINSWTPDWQGIYSGTYTIEPGVPYDFVLEYFEDGGDAHIQLEMVSDTVTQRYVDTSDFIQVDLSGIQTQFTNSKTGTLADGSDSVTIEIELLDESNQPISDDVYINVTGTDVFVDGTEVNETDWILIDESNTDGLYEFDLSSWEPEEKGIQVRVGNFPIEEIYYYEFSIADINSGLLGEYFNNMTLEDPSYTTLNNQVIDYDWGDSAPMNGMPADAFSVRWTGYVIPDYTETYTFYTYSDDGMRLWIDGTLLIDAWFDQGPTEYSEDIDMIAGEEYEIIVEYYENGGGAVAGLKWESPSLIKEVIRRNNLFMPWFDIYNYEIDVSETEVINDGVDSAQISVQLTNYIDLPLSGEDVLVQISGEDNYIDGVLLEDDDWVPLHEEGTTGQYIGELTSTTKGIKYIKFKIRDLLLDDEYPVRFMEEEIVYPDCEISTISDGEVDIVQLIVEEDTSCKLVPNTYDIDYVNIAGTLYLESENTYDEATEQYSSTYVEINADAVEVTETGLISADGKGYLSGEGPGAPEDGDDENTPGGGGYGGYGGDGDLDGGDPYFGNSITPGDNTLYAGSGGGGPYGGAGGGIISITANYLYNEGEISADGENGSNYRSDFYSGGGSGGSIYIYAEDMENYGIITANGGNSFEDCTDITCGGGGSGGRILLQTDSDYSSLVNNIHSIGGNGNVSNLSGAAGTVLFDEISSENWDKFLYIRNNNQNGKFSTIEPGVFNEIDEIFAEEKGRIRIPATNYLGEEVICLPWTYSFNGDHTGEFYFDCKINESEYGGPSWGSDADITIASSQFIVDDFRVIGNVDFIVPSDTPDYSFNDIYIDNEGELTYQLNVNQDFVLSPQSITIQEGSSLNIPNNGGQVTIEIVDNEMIVAGTISVNGSAGGDGGNLELLVDGLSGSGTIQTNGSSSENPGDGGSIKFAIPYSEFAGYMQAYGGEYGEYTGDPGIILDEIYNILTIDNNGNGGTVTMPEGVYSYNRIELGNGILLDFEGENTEVTILDGAYSIDGEIFDVTPILSIEGSLITGDEFTVYGVIIDWEDSSNLVVNDETITLTTPDDGTSLSYESIIVRNGGKLILAPDDEEDIITINAGSISVEEGCEIESSDSEGTIAFNVTDVFEISGTVSANGEDNQDAGAIIINSNLISGSGTIQANGGEGSSAGDGGNIELDYISNAFAGTIETLGGIVGETVGAPGTICDIVQNTLIVNNGANGGVLTIAEGTYSYGSIELGDGVEVVFAGENTDLTITDDISPYNGTVYENIPTLTVEGLLHAPASFLIENVNVSSIIDSVDNLSINNGELELRYALDSNQYVFDALQILSGAVLSLYPDDTQSEIEVNATFINVDTGGSIQSTSANVTTTYDVSSDFMINGSLLSNGVDDENGGEILITTNVLSGSGSILANGGDGDTPGKGGRIDINYGTNEFAGVINTYGGDNGDAFGGPGIIYIIPDDKVVIDNGENGGEIVYPEGTYSFANLELGQAIDLLFEGENSELSIQNLSSIGNSVYTIKPELNAAGLIHTPIEFSIFGVDLIGEMDTVESISIGEGTVIIDIPSDTNSINYDGISILENGIIYLEPDESASEFTFEANNINVESGGALQNADATIPMVLNVINELYVDGVVSSNGESGFQGGNINIDVNVLSGSGTIQANGGGGDDPGTGGNIDVNYVDNQFAGSIQAYGGGYSIVYQEQAAPGLVYYIPEGRLVVYNNNAGGTKIVPEGEYSYNRIDLEQKMHLVFEGENTELTLVEGIYTNYKMSYRYDPYFPKFTIEGILHGPTNFDIYRYDFFGKLDSTTNFSVSWNSRATLYGYESDGEYLFGDLTVGGSSKLTIIPYFSNDDNYADDLPFIIKADYIEVGLSSSIILDYSGYTSDETCIGQGPGGGWGTCSTTSPSNGGSHGGNAGYIPSTGYGPSEPYGSEFEPITFGSGGGGTSTSAGAGGGAIKITAFESIHSWGTISANGAAGSEYSGGGAGGSIWIYSPRISGGGYIRANGGGSTNGGAGSGGRIVIDTPDLDSGQLIYASGGYSTSEAAIAAEHGTIYLGELDPVASTVVATPSEIVLDEDPESTVVVTAIVENGHVLPYQSITLTLVSGDSLQIDGETLDINESITFGETDCRYGQVSFSASAETVGIRDLLVKVGDVELDTHAILSFEPGEIDADLSAIQVDLEAVPIDGETSSEVTLTIKDQNSNPVVNVPVVISASGDAIITQPSEPTDENGQTTGSIIDNTPEVVTVGATAWGVQLTDAPTVEFYGADLFASLTPAQFAVPGQIITLKITVKNLEVNAYAINDVEIALTLPEELSFISHTATEEPIIDGQTYTWIWDQLVYGQVDNSFLIDCQVSEDLETGNSFSPSLLVISPILENDSSNNYSEALITVASGYSFESSIVPDDSILRLGGETEYEITVNNTDLLPDLYSVSVSGLDQFDTLLSENELSIGPGANKISTLTIGTDTCLSDPLVNFDVLITSAQSGIEQTLPATMTLDSTPDIELVAPANDATSGSQSVLFSWRTDPETSGTLTIYPTDNPDAIQTYASESGVNHAIQVENLSRNTSYTWHVDAVSNCGNESSLDRVLNIGNGIVFSNHDQNITIDRNYDQRIDVSIQNTDTLAHTLTSSVINPYEDLIVNFVDSGSVDQTITLQPGETVNLTLAVHAQDAELHDYVLTANLIADEDTTPIIDNANLNVEVLFEGDYTIEEDVAAYNPITLAHTYVITNHGQTITDLSLEAIDPTTGLVASILLTPSLDHAKLDTGESIRVEAYPIFTEEDAVNHIAYASTLKMAKADLDSYSEIQYVLYADGAGIQKSFSDDISCGDGNQIYQVEIEECELDFYSKNWYCTNKPIVSTQFNVPSFIKTDDLSNLSVTMSFSPWSNARKHDAKFYLNGTEFKEFSNAIPDGSFTFDIPLDSWQEAAGGPVSQELKIETYHPNFGHYVVATGYNLNVGISSTTTYACASTTEEAKSAIESMYPCNSQVTPFNAETDVYDDSTLEINESINDTNSIFDSLVIETNIARCLHASCADPIDTKTGVFSFTTTDVSFPTTLGTLAFQRAYSSGSVDQYSTVGYGWTHNHEERLIFPENSFGMEDYIIFRDHIGNQNLFKINENGTFSPGPGVLAELVTVTDGYEVITYDGYTFSFNSIGMIISLTDAQGNAFTYTYDDEGILQRVSADNGTRYLDFTYNDDVRIVTVTDYTGRQVEFDYNLDGEMVLSTDLLDQKWVYEYDEDHLMTALNDPTGLQTVSTEYDILGRANKQFDINGDLLIKIDRQEDGTVIVYDAEGNSETYSYDSRGIMIEETDQADRGVDTIYDANFRPTSITNAIGSTLILEWSEDGKQLLAEVESSGNRTEYTYDENGNLTSTTDPSGNTKSNTYESNLLTSSTDIDGKTTMYTYTVEGWLETKTDHYGRTTTYTYDDHGQHLTTTDWLGVTTSNVYDELGRQIESVDEQGRVNRNEYNVAGQLVRSIWNYDELRPQNDENLYNLTTTYTYDVYGNQETITDTLGLTTTYTYDSNGRLVSTVDAMGHETTNVYDVNGQLVKTTDALGRETTYVYDAVGRILSTVNALGISSGTTTFDLTNNASTASDSEGNAATYYYNELNQVVRIVDPMGHETTTTYNENGNVETKTDELGRTTTYEYDDLNRLVKTTDTSGAVTQTVYDENGYRTATIDALGNETTYTYDEMGRVVSTTDPLGHTTSSDYDDDGKLVSITDAMGRTTIYTYDEWNRKASMTDGAGHTTTYTYDGLDRVISTSGPTGVTYTSYDALGRVVSRTDARGHTTTTTYDDLGREKTSTDYQGNTTINYYDQVGNLLSSVDSQGTTSFEYDMLNRLVAVIDPLGNRTRTVYDNLGNVSDTINAKGIVTHYIYDSLQRNIAIIQNYKPGEEADADTNVRVDYTYNAVGNRTYVNDANGHVTEFQYDAANRVARKIDPIGITWDYVYDLTGNLTSRTDGNGVTTYFVYDDGGNLLTIDYPDGEADVSFTYNNAGQRVTMTDGIGTTTWHYDELSRVESVNDAYGNEIVYTYDEYGNRTGLQYADGKQVAYDFDSSNRLVEVASWDSLETEYDYDALGQLISILRPNGVESTYEYDALGRLTSLDHSNDVTSLANYTYTYDEVGNIIHAEENVMGGGSYGPTILVTVVDTTGEPLAEKNVYAFNGDEYSNYSKVTDEKGQVSITLPDGIYRFRVDVDGTQFWSGETDHCEIGACGQVTMTIPEAVLVTVIDSNNNYLAEQTVYAFEGETYSNHSGQTDENGQVSLRLPEGQYRFRTALNGTQFWSAALEDEQCVVPGCTVDEILVTVPLVVTVQNDLGDPMVDLNVYAFNETTYANINGKTDEYGQVELTLPEGEYRFRADYNGTQFWSADANHCAIPGCSEAAVTVSLPVTVTVADAGGALISGINVYAFDETTYQNFSKQTDENGEAVFTLPSGNYRFRADYNGTQFWSGSENTCEIPGCTADAVTVTQPITVTVLDSNGAPQNGLNVYAFNGTTYANYSKQTDENGEAVFTLPLGDYRFRADLNGTQFWSGTSNTCSLPDCGSDQVSVTIPVEVTILNGTAGAESVNVYAFNGTTYSGYSKTTGSDGVAIFTLPEGDYRFRADYNGEQIFSDVNNHCTIPGCELVSIQVGTEPTQTPTVMPTETFTFTPVQTTAAADTHTPTPLNSNTPVPDTNTPLPEDTDTPEPVETDTPEPEDTHTPTPEYSSTPTQTIGMISRAHGLAKLRLAPLADDTGVSVTVLDSDGTPQSGLNVYAFDGTTYSGSSAVTNESGIASFTLAEGSYRFRADLNGTRFWSDEDNTCTTPSCVSDSVTVTKPLTITVVDSDGTAQSGLNVYAFNGTTYAGYSKVTNESGEAVFTLPEGDYHFRADLNGTRFWSGTENHCTLPDCESANVTVTKPLTVTVSNSDGTLQSGLNVYAFNGTTYSGYSKVTDENGAAVFTLPEGDYRFRTDLNGTRFWSADENHCTLPGCESVDVSVTVPLTVSVVDTDGTPQSGIAVYAFNGTTYMNYSKTTDEYGQAVFTLPDGDYRFRADAGGTQYWSSEENDCTLPGCTVTTVTTSKPVTVSVVDSFGTPQIGLSVYAFDGTTYSGYSKVTDEYGVASFYLPAGDYHFRADSGGTQYWPSEENACTIPGCESVIISVTLPVTVIVVDTDGTVQEGLSVYAFDGETYSNYSKVTDENGVAVFNLPVGNYRFRADLNGTQFWSSEENNCALPGCATESVTVTKPVTVTVEGEEGNPYADLNVYAFNGETYSGYSGKTDAGGHVTFTLPVGSYHFRADYDGVQFWSNNENSCTIPGCEEDSVILPGGTGEQEISIDYTYDALNRLISAEYSNGTAFSYTYDAAGNVLTYAETHYGQTTVTTYTYDAANQLLIATEDDPSTSSGSTWHYSYDGNGSLIQTDPGTEVANGSKRYTYNTAGYLTKVENYTTEWQTQSEMTYDGLGNRMEVTTYTDGEGNTTRYVLDGGTELTAIGADSTTYYLYGRGVIGTLGETWSYILSDGVGSTRQLVDEEGAVTLSVSYTPWGDTMEIYGSGMLNLGYLGGVYDVGTGLIYMGNGQYYDPSTGRFLTGGVNNESINTYAPWSNNVASMLISPLTLLVLLYGRKKTRTKFNNFIIILVLVLSISTNMFVVAENCIPSVYATANESSIGSPFQPPSPEDIDFPENTPGTVIVAVSRVVERTSKENLCDYENIILYINGLVNNSKYIDPAREPDFVNWNPSVYLPDHLLEVGISQNYVDYNEDGWIEETDSIFALGPNLCGQLSLSIITWALTGDTYKYTVLDMLEAADDIMGTPSVTTKSGEVYSVNHFVKTTSQGDLAKILLYNNFIRPRGAHLAVRTHANTEIRRWYLASGYSTFVTLDDGSREFATLADGRKNVQFASYKDGSLHESVYLKEKLGYPLFLQGIAGMGHYYVALTDIDESGYFQYQGPVGHWVVITGFSDRWIKDPKSNANWVRIYNPYFNRTEYYRWPEFVTYLNPGIALEVWKE